jgi:hypothetical protein
VNLRYDHPFVSGQWIEVPGWPGWVAGGLIGLAFLGALVAVVAVVRRGWLGLLVLPGAGVGLLVGAGLATLPALLTLPDGAPGSPDAAPVGLAHATVVTVATALSIAGGAGFGAAASAAAVGQGPLRWAGIPGALAGLGGAFAAMLWAAWILDTGPVPSLVVPYSRAHLGQSVALEVPGLVDSGYSLESGPTFAGVGHAAGLVAGPEVGIQTLALVAGKGPVRTGHVANLEVGQPDGDPRLPLDEGNTWIFSTSAKTGGMQLLWVLPVRGSTTEDVGRTYVRVDVVDKTGPMIVHRVRASDGSMVQVTGWNGAWEVTDGAPSAIAPADAPPLLTGTEPDVLTPLLPGWRCTFGPAQGGDLTLAGPTACQRATANTGDVIGSLFLGIVTAGLVLNDPTKRETLSVIASGNLPPPPEPPPAEPTPPPEGAASGPAPAEPTSGNGVPPAGP